MNINQEIKAVEMLGETIGYGNMMALASAIWRKKLKDSGIPEIGAFVPTISSFIKKGYYSKENQAQYDNEISKHFESQTP